MIRVACLLAGLAACAPDPSSAALVRPGETLLDHLALAEASAGPSILPADVVAAQAAGAPRAVAIPRESWERADRAPPAKLQEIAGRADLVAWVAPRDDLGPAADVAAVLVDGQVLRLYEPPEEAWHFTNADLWQRGDEALLVWWSAQGPVLVTPDGSARDVLCVWKDGARPALVEAPHEGAPASWVGTWAHHDVHRRALVIPAGGDVTWSLGRLAADGLQLALGVPDFGARPEQGRLVERPAVGDGVTFRVLLTDLDAPQTEVVVWDQHVPAGRGWVTGRADLSAYSGREVRLTLASEPGPAGDVSFDLGVWADLRLVGEATMKPSRPHLVLIDIDTLRADRLGCYGYERDTSPGLDAWVERWSGSGAVLFADCIATSSWTLPSTVSLLTGLTPTQHGTDHPSRALSPDLPSVATLLRDAGYETYALTEGGYTDPSYGIGAGFDTYVVHPDHEVDWSPVTRWLDERDAERPFFLFLQTFAVHAPYEHDDRFEDPDEPYRGPLLARAIEHGLAGHVGDDLTPADEAYVSRLYDAGIRRFDDDLAAFLAWLDERFGPQELAVVITSDHGEEFFEHGGLDHGHSLHVELLAVPLIVRLPTPVVGVDARSDLPVTILDVVPTLLDLARLPPPDGLPGRSLIALLEEGRRGDPGRRPRGAWLGRRYRSIQQGGAKLILPGDNPLVSDESPQLYELASDPTEQRDRAAEQTDRVAALQRMLERLDQRYPKQGEADEAKPDASTLNALRQLGYLGDG